MGSGTTFSSGSLPALPPQSPGVAAYSPSARRKKKKPVVLPTRRASLRSLLGRCAERWRKGFPRGYPDDSRKSRGRASGGLGAAPPVMRTGGAVASRPRNSPYPKKAPAPPAQRGLFSSHGPRKRLYGSRRPMTAARSIPRRWGPL